MEEAYKGWRYVNTLLDYMFDEAKKRRENHVVAQRYIFRGVTQRFFYFFKINSRIFKEESW